LPPGRIELTTPGLQDQCSATELRRHRIFIKNSICRKLLNIFYFFCFIYRKFIHRWCGQYRMPLLLILFWNFEILKWNTNLIESGVWPVLDGVLNLKAEYYSRVLLRWCLNIRLFVIYMEIWKIKLILSLIKIIQHNNKYLLIMLFFYIYRQYHCVAHYWKSSKLI
jgi:hypothetical protein